jgi:hypothetical protein
MNIFVRIIPFIELLLVLAVLGLGSLGYLILSRKPDQSGYNQYKSIEKWVMPGLIGLAILAILLLFIVSFIEE